MTNTTDDHSETAKPLPDKTSITDHHEAVKNAGNHPVIGMDVEYDDIADGLDDGINVSDKDRMIGIMERNECPICGRRGTLSMAESFGVARWVSSNTRDGYNWTLNELSDDGYRPIFCSDIDSDRHHVYLVGVATPEAADEWRDWKSERDDIKSFQRTAIRLAQYPDTLTGTVHQTLKPPRMIDVPLDSMYDQGDLLAAIYYTLDCSGYDPRDLMGRKQVTKKQLATVLTRLWSLEVSPSRDTSAKEWLDIERFGNKHGKVQWKIPSWAGTDEVTASSRYKRGTYADVMVEDDFGEE